MNNIEIDLSKNDVLQLKRGEKIQVVFGDKIIVIKGPSKEIKNARLY